MGETKINYLFIYFYLYKLGPAQKEKKASKEKPAFLWAKLAVLKE